MSELVFEDVIARRVVLYAFFFISLAANTIAIVCIVRKQQKKQSKVDTSILHLTVANLSASFFLYLADLIWLYTVQWEAGNVMCKVMMFLKMMSLFATAYVTVVVTLERCLGVMCPGDPGTALRRTYVMLLGAWTMSVLFSLPQLYTFRVMAHPHHDTFKQCVTFGAFSSRLQETLYQRLLSIAVFFAPALIIVIAFALICYKRLGSQQERGFDNVDETPPRDESGSETTELSPKPTELEIPSNHSLLMSGVIAVAFICCWAPFSVMTFASIMNLPIMMAAYYLGLSYTLVNPAIYVIFNCCTHRENQ